MEIVRPYIDIESGRTIYLSDQQARERDASTFRRILPGEQPPPPLEPTPDVLPQDVGMPAYNPPYSGDVGEVADAPLPPARTPIR